MSTSKQLFLEDPEEETQAEESFWGRAASQGEKGASKKTSLFGAKEEKKTKAARGGASSRPDTQREYAKALDPKGAVAKSIGKPYKGSNPVHAAFSAVFTPTWHAEIKASVQSFDRFLVETETKKSAQRVQRAGGDFKGKAQAAASSTAACAEETSAFFNTCKQTRSVIEEDFCLSTPEGDIYGHHTLADETAEDIGYWSWSLKQKIRKWHSQDILNTTTFLEENGYDVPSTAFKCQRILREGILFLVPETAFEVKTAPLTLLGGRILSPMVTGITKSVTAAGRKGAGLLKRNAAVAAAFEKLTQKSSRLIEALNLEKTLFLPPLALEEATVRTLKVSQTVEKRAAGEVLSRDRGRFGLEESSFLKPSGGLSTEKRSTTLQERFGSVGKRQEASALSQKMETTAAKGPLVKPGEQPWTLKEGQGWKDKIIGRGQTTKTEKHAHTSNAIAIQEAKKETTQTVYQDRSMNRILRDLGIKNPNIAKNRRHDVTIVDKDGKIHLREVQSRSDEIKELRSRMQETFDQLPEHMRGTTDVLPANKDIILI